MREKQKSEEVSRLQEVIQKLLHDAGTKTKEEVMLFEAWVSSCTHCNLQPSARNYFTTCILVDE